jgi:hypothetical protein
MEKEKINILALIEETLEKAKTEGKAAFYTETKPQLKTIAETLKITEIQALLFSTILERAGGEPVSLNDIARAYQCTNIQMFAYAEEFEELERKGMIRSAKEGWVPRSQLWRKGATFPDYVVPYAVIQSVREGRPYRDNTNRNLSPEKFFEEADKLIEACIDDAFPKENLMEEVLRLCAKNHKSAFVKNAKNLRLNKHHIVLMLVFCCAYANEDIQELPLKRLNPIFGRYMVKGLADNIRKGKFPLFVKGFLDYADESLTDGETLRLTQKGIETFLSDVTLLDKPRKGGRNIIRHEDIKNRKLFHPVKIQNRVKELTQLLCEDNFSGIKKRLKDMNMRTAFTCIFSGPPGTGKTETAYQIARETGRDIYLVDISETKSMWFGESEKRIKEVFDRYKGMLRNSKPSPILLFNEADAVLSKRQELADTRRGPAQTENAIQNIILQEMENLEGGILIATTNMKTNLDKAFERRFLYKLDFEKPDTETRAAIWQEFIPALRENDALALAGRFNFSGGQIENITRKNAVSFLLSGAETTVETLSALCEEEPAEQGAVRIGFLQ